MRQAAKRSVCLGGRLVETSLLAATLFIKRLL